MNRHLKSLSRRVKVAVAVLSAAVVFAEAAPALAFDRGPHTELTASSMAAEGFSGDAVGIAQVENWFVDLYHELSAEKMPSSGEAGVFKRLLVGVLRSENWSDALIGAATRSHFDNNPDKPLESQMPSLVDTPGVTAEWNRLQRAVWTLVQEAREENDPEKLVEVIGMSLHPVQDFYSHTNWIEPRQGSNVAGTDGPGWRERGLGSNPTWFDIPEDLRDTANVYGDATTGHRPHGLWDADNNRSLSSAMNKDWEGRPLHVQAVTSAYFASRQWIEAIRNWVGDEAFWARTQDLRADRAELHHDIEGMLDIMRHSGHWHGQGEPTGGFSDGPGGNLLALRQAVKRYFQPTKAELIGTAINPGMGTLGADFLKRGMTRYRARFERLIMRMAERNPTGQIGPVPSSQGLQSSMRMVVLRINFLESQGLGDIYPDPADMYANVRIDGQPMTSAVFNNSDKADGFIDPYEPFTWVKAVPAEPREVTPVESVVAEVKTADKRWAGTDDDVYLRLGPNLRFPLDNRLYNDFERGDIDNYSVPIDDAVKNGMTVGDITEVKLEKSGDGIAGGWMLGGLRLRVNGRLVVNDEDINRWLEDDHRVWKAPDFEPESPTGNEIPIWINLKDFDLFAGTDDEGDINPFGHRRTVVIPFPVGGSLISDTEGGNRFGGRIGDGDEARIMYKVETVVPETMGTDSSAPPSQPLVPEAKPDLVITAFDFRGVTILNQGPGPSGPFRVRAGNAFQVATVNFGGLAPGASETRALNLSCEGLYQAIVDDLQLVDELDESNNEAPSEPPVC